MVDNKEKEKEIAPVVVTQLNWPNEDPVVYVRIGMSGPIIGHGPTEKEAVKDALDSIEYYDNSLKIIASKYE